MKLDALLLLVPLFVGSLMLDVLYCLFAKTGHYRFNDTLNSMSHGILSRLAKAFTNNLVRFPYLWVHENLRLTDISVQADSFLPCLALVLGIDLGFYLAHRTAHKVNFFWGGHKTHHSSEDFNLSTALRQSGIEDLFSWVWYIPLAFFFDFNVFRLYFDINLVWQFWVHTQHIGKGPWWFEFVFVTPSHHRVHHASNPTYIDANFGGFLIIWDRLFGTFVEERDDVKPVYGITDTLDHWNASYSQISHWVYLWERVRRFPKEGLLAKLQVIFYGPGWSPKNRSYYPVRPVSAETFVKYDPYFSPRLRPYILVQFLATLGVSLFVFVLYPVASISLAAVSVFLGFSLSCCGKLMEGHTRATKSRQWETLRLVSLLLVSLVWPFTGINQQEAQTWCIPSASFAAFSLLWFFAIHHALDEIDPKAKSPGATVAAPAATSNSLPKKQN